LVTGASQGARNINRSIIASLDLFEASNWQILHLTGEADYEEVRSAYAGRKVRATVLPYTHDMPEALAVADLVVARAGASFLAELTVVGRASILLPYPFHRDQHQLANARCLSCHRAAEIVEDRREVRLTAPVLRTALVKLMDDDRCRESMAVSAASLGRRDAAASVAIHILKWSADSNLSRAGESLQGLC
jgi:UDP-N-acetylglucosamine--N-acetylmuramyl-(pentapeptide) pyrophosphoryl-undecaprenol N-acetylglucosamine transferase